MKADRYEVVETWHSEIQRICGLQPLVKVRSYRWKWWAHIQATLAFHIGPLGVNITHVRKARQVLRVIQGGKPPSASGSES